MATVGTAAAAAGKKLYSSAQETADYGDTVDKMSQKLGTQQKILSRVGLRAQSVRRWHQKHDRRHENADQSDQRGKDGNDDAIERFNKLGISPICKTFHVRKFSFPK